MCYIIICITIFIITVCLYVGLKTSKILKHKDADTRDESICNKHDYDIKTNDTNTLLNNNEKIIEPRHKILYPNKIDDMIEETFGYWRHNIKLLDPYIVDIFNNVVYKFVEEGLFGSCFMASILVTEKLKEYNIDASVVEGYYVRDNIRSYCSHYWVRVWNQTLQQYFNLDPGNEINIRLFGDYERLFGRIIKTIPEKYKCSNVGNESNKMKIAHNLYLSGHLKYIIKGAPQNIKNIINNLHLK